MTPAGPRTTTHPRLLRLAVSRALADAGIQALLYGALVIVVREGNSAFEASLVAGAALVPPTALGLWGGLLADRLPRRTALSLAYLVQACVCLLAAALAGTGFMTMVAVVLAAGLAWERG